MNWLPLFVVAAVSVVAWGVVAPWADRIDRRHGWGRYYRKEDQ